MQRYLAAAAAAMAAMQWCLTRWTAAATLMQPYPQVLAGHRVLLCANSIRLLVTMRLC